MRSKILFIVSLLLLSLNKGKSQPFFNEWINYNQQYFKFTIARDGVYRIDYETLQKANINMGIVKDANFQIFARGEEIPIYIEKGADNIFNTGDYIEFYAKRNDGWLDKFLYKNPNNHFSDYKSIASDTIYYYLTFNDKVTNKRFELQTNTNNYNNYTATEYCWVDVELPTNFSPYYHPGIPNLLGTTSAEYVKGEGIMTAVVFRDNISNYKITINTPNPYKNNVDAKMTARFLTVYDAPNKTDDYNFSFKISNQELYQTYADGNNVYNFQFNIPINLIGTNTTDWFTTFSKNNINPIPGNILTGLVYYKLSYPRTTDLLNLTTFLFRLKHNTNEAKTYIRFGRFNHQYTNVWLYDLTNNKRIKVDRTTINGVNYFDVLVNKGNENNLYFLFSEASPVKITKLIPVSTDENNYAKFINYSQTKDFNYLIVTHQSLMTGANDYATYRNTTGYNSLVVDVEQLYDQFAYGVKKHPLAIRKFADYTLKTWTQKPQYLFLLGKAREPNGVLTNFQGTLVPTYGIPPSDALITFGLNGNYEPAIPTGRLAAQNTQDVYIYLDKIKEHETAPAAIWKKNILHFAGGKNQYETSYIISHLNQYQQSIEDTLYGGKVTLYSKNSTDPIQTSIASQIFDKINEGTSLMTLFGHATGYSFDFSIDQLENYQNKGKYPLMLALSCYSGNIHKPDISVSERMVITPNKGLMGFVSTVSRGDSYYLHKYSQLFYQNIAKDLYGQSIGKVMQRSSEQITNIDLNNNLFSDMAYEMTLHGDPALILNNASKPDFSINEHSLTLNPKIITSEMDSVEVTLKIENLGKTYNQPFTVGIERFYPNGKKESLTKIVYKCYYQSSLTFKIPIGSFVGVGLNQIKIHVDNIFSVDELSETNNNFTYNFFVTAPDIVPIYPPKFAVVPKDTITLKASTGKVLAGQRTYIFEIDTVDSFNSPFKQTKQITSKGGVVNWKLPFNMTDSTVYFWRVALDSVLIDNTKYTWRESSFQYINGKYGWGQAHFYQFKDDNFYQIKYDKPNRLLSFLPSEKLLTAQNRGNPNSDLLYSMIKYDLDLVNQTESGCMPWAAMYIAVIDPVTLNPVTIHDYIFQNIGNHNPVGSDCSYKDKIAIYWHNASVAPQPNLINLIKNKIPDGYYILLYSFIEGFYPNWSEDGRKTLEDLGATQIRNITISRAPYIFFTQKGNNASTVEVVGTHANDTINFQTKLKGKLNNGMIESTLIGPTKKWQSLHWRYKEIEVSPNPDSVLVQVVGVKNDGTSKVVMENIIKTELDIPNLYNYVDAKEYPYLKLIFKTQDPVNLTPAQLNRWHVLFDEVPEAAINPNISYYLNKNTIHEGENLKFAVTISNISNTNMDSLLVDYWIVDQNNMVHKIPYKRQKPLLANTNFTDTITVNTLGITGASYLWVEVNPRNDQIEQYHFNNLANVPLYVIKDIANPLLDITFDGVRIMNGDIVSAKPLIQITLKDENKYLLLNDTSLVKIFIRWPNGTQKPIYFNGNNSNQILTFIPASDANNNQLKIEIKGNFEQDGEYELMVQAKDRSNNESGAVDLKIKFNVVTKSTITQVINYPNPFSTSTRFVFILTGSQVPDYFKIQIYNINGKLVKEITQDELGPLRVGRNVTDYAWDGTDNFGDKLANGVYFYRVITNINNQTIEHSSTKADQFFKNGFGKLYIIR